MGSHRADPNAANEPDESARAASAPNGYVGRRACRPTAAALPPGEPAVAALTALPEVLGPAPVSLASSDGWRRLDPGAIIDTSAFAELDLSTEPPLAGSGGRRRAPGRRCATSPRPRRLLTSAPLLAGVATLAIAVGGALASTGPTLVSDHTAQISAASALGGSSGSAMVDSSRTTPTTSRSADRQGLQAAVDSTPASGTQIAHHDAAMDQLAQAAQHQAARLNNNRWDLPIQVGVYHLTARFGDTGLWASFHTGLDFACGIGTPIHAVASGTVTFASYDGAYGNKTVVTLPDGTEIWYGHQTTQYVKVGDTVTRGQVIGTVGATGHVTGPHVHIEVRPGGGDPVDPFPAFVQHGVTP